MPQVNRNWRQYWRRILVGNFIAAAIVLFAFSNVSFDTPPAELLRSYLISLLFASFIGPLLGVTMPYIAPPIWRRLGFPLNWVAVAVAMAGLALVGSLAAIAVLVAVGTVPTASFWGWFRGSFRVSIIVTLTLGLFITAYEMMRARVAQATAEAQLASLESRVQPHFLFNTLNSISALIHEDPKGAEQMTVQLASLLRSSLDQPSTPLVPLDEEIRTVRDYLAIEHVRFGDRLRYDVRVDPSATGTRVPRMSVQTVVENAVKYAVGTRREGASISISVARAERRIDVRVADDGPGFDSSTLPPGHGLALLRDRLTLLFGRSAWMHIESRVSGTVVSLVLPASAAVQDTPPECEPRPAASAALREPGGIN
jgi:glucose-6-phosphate-specific signal transduction histidine kinase